ncbi:hypothetical protein J4462_01300 [Candidatus Pacearchaeota archaeon]|nr:hypothetical protein [Candidatus Pacearchaeota archaeon]
MEEMTKILLIKKIKEKKELSGISDSVVLDSLDNYLKKYSINIQKIKHSQIKIIVKEIRANLRKLVGQYQISKKQIIENLDSHTSTRERKDFYPKLKKMIEKINPCSILDLGCGLNPLALAEKNIFYYASDINETALSLVEQHFKRNKIKGKIFVYDIRKINNDLPKADLCLLFKILDILDKNLAEKIISSVPCDKILVSFATKKLSGKKMSRPIRIWFEKILERNLWKYEKIYSDNEIFYSIEKM